MNKVTLKNLKNGRLINLSPHQAAMILKHYGNQFTEVDLSSVVDIVKTVMDTENKPEAFIIEQEDKVDSFESKENDSIKPIKSNKKSKVNNNESTDITTV